MVVCLRIRCPKKIPCSLVTTFPIFGVILGVPSCWSFLRYTQIQPIPTGGGRNMLIQLNSDSKNLNLWPRKEKQERLAPKKSHSKRQQVFLWQTSWSHLEENHKGYPLCLLAERPHTTVIMISLWFQDPNARQALQRKNNPKCFVYVLHSTI